MFSLESFYFIITKNLLKPFFSPYGVAHFFKRFGSTDPKDLDRIFTSGRGLLEDRKHIIFYDQEPIYSNQFEKLFHQPSIDMPYSASWREIQGLLWLDFDLAYFKNKFYLIANSEHSQEKDDLLKYYSLLDWYYFFHGFAALDWYRNIQYLPPIKTFSKVFISFNNLINEKRSYRLILISMIVQSNLDKYGYISMNQEDTVKKITNELYSPNSLLSKKSKKLIYNTLLPNPPSLIIDTNTTTGSLSADDNLDTLSLGLFHVVTETIFYDEKLHLTEKIFKPIVARRPFLLVGAPGNLAYLKSYGFRTFNRWIDESYDLEKDPDQRLTKIVNELDKLCKLSESELVQMYEEMQDILEYNFHWFYNGFKKQITDELVDNFEIAIKKYNAGKDKSFENYIDSSLVDFDAVKKRLLG
jgi:hypothetical protein